MMKYHGSQIPVHDKVFSDQQQNEKKNNVKVFQQDQFIQSKQPSFTIEL